MMYLTILENLHENTCAEVSTYHLNSQSMGRPDKCRSNHWRRSAKKWCSYKFRKFHTKALALESLFNKVAANQACNFAKIRL